MEPDEAANFFGVRVQRHHSSPVFALIDGARRNALHHPCDAGDMARLVLQEAERRRAAAANRETQRRLLLRLHAGR
jgi:hypothetical protein